MIEKPESEDGLRTRLRRSRLPFLLMAFFIAFTAEGGFACTCFGPMNAKTMREAVAWYSEGKNSAMIVFEGAVEKQGLKTGAIGAPTTAMSMTGQGEHRMVFLRVLRSYRGEIGSNATVFTGLGGGDCGFDFETGKQYLVYASRIDPETLFTSICTGTSPLENAGPALRLLRGEVPTPDDLLDPARYYGKFMPQWTGTACGRVTLADGRPFGKASVDMTQVRDEPFPSKSASDPDLSKPDGSFCIRGISPGKYLLTADKTDFDHHMRWMGYYPSVAKHSEATTIEVKPGANLKGLNFTVRKEQVYTVSFKIVASDGSPLPLDDLGVAIDGVDRDALSYHLAQHIDEGKYRVGYVPPGHYVVRTIPWGMPSRAVLPEISKWRMAEQEVEIKSAADTNIVLKLIPAD